MKRSKRLFGLAVLFAAAVLTPAAARAAGRVEMQEFMVPAADPGVQLYVHNKHPAGAKAFSADRTLVYVHGATYPAETAFDLPVGGASMMDMLAARGWDGCSTCAVTAAPPGRRRWNGPLLTASRSWTLRRPPVTWGRSWIS